jgi:hypothetical protein
VDVESLAKQLILQNMTPEQQSAVLESVRSTLQEARGNQKRRVSENVGVVVDALRKIEADIRAKYDDLGNKITARVNSIRDGRDGTNGSDGRDGLDGRPGRDGAQGPAGPAGRDGVNGVDGVDGVSVTDAKIDFDGSLVISLSNGREINVGEVVAPDVAEKIRVVANGGGTSQTVIDALASLQTQINNIYPSQTGNAGKFLTTNGTVVSWASVAGGLSYQGTWNASANTPTLASGVGVNGYYYIVATAGSTNLDGITDWQIGDWLMFNGTVWQKIDQSNLVTSVNGQTGAVSLTTTNINEGTNQYYLDSRARSAISAGTGISYSSSTGVVTNSAPDQTVALTAGTGISTSGTYPSFTITNSAPDQTVALTGAGTTSISGTYPNFTITSNDQYTGTVTSVGGTGTVNGISLSGTVTSSGSLTLGGTLSNVSLATQVTGTLPIANGGTGQTTRQAAMDALAGAVTAGQYLRGDGADVVMSAIQVADVPTLNQNTTGSAATLTTARTIQTNLASTSSASFNGSANITPGVTGTLPIANGGTGITSFGTGVATALGVNTGSSGAFVVNGGALGTPSSGTVTNLTGTASININGTVGATTANTGAFTTLSATGVTTVQAGSASAPAITTSGDTNTGIFFPAADTIAFAEGGVEIGRFDSSGNLLVGTTTVIGSNGCVLEKTGNGGRLYVRRSNADTVAEWYYDSTRVGTVSINSTNTSYNTGSDYRLKEDVQPMTAALAKVAALNPCTFKWKVDGSDGEGFIAHELQTICPNAVTGEKDAVDANGNPVYQGIDTSFLVATLTAAIQEQQAMIEELKAKVAALEAK